MRNASDLWPIAIVAAAILGLVIYGIVSALARRKKLRALGPDGIRRLREMELAGMIRADKLYDAKEYARRHGLELPTDELLRLAQHRLSRVKGHAVDFFALSDAVEVFELAGVALPQREIQPLIIQGMGQPQEYLSYAVQTAHVIAKKFPVFPHDALSTAGRELMCRGEFIGASLLTWIGEQPSAELYRRCGDALMKKPDQREHARSAYECAVEREQQELAAAV